MIGPVAIFGSGARESALAESFYKSQLAESVIVVPGNGGPYTPPLERPLVSAVDLLAWAKQARPALSIVGPEALLADGIVDLFTQNGLAIVGPTQSAARLESSKIFAKQFLRRHGIPTAGFSYANSLAAAREIIGREPAGQPLVVKADSLAAGKGVVVAADASKAQDAAEAIVRQYGERLVIERLLTGTECSYIVFVANDGTVYALPSAQDHKRQLDGDKGPNTGGMGCFAPHYAIDAAMEQRIVVEIVRPTLVGLAKEGIAYHGFLYFGLMLTAEGPMVLEFNARMGDPEASVILPLVDPGLWKSLLAGALRPRRGSGTDFGIYDSRTTRIIGEHAVSVVLASEHYPITKDPSVPITGIAEAEATGAVVLHAGTKRVGDQIMTNGGRVLVVVGTGGTYAVARQQAYAGAGCIRFAGMQYRKDIAAGL